MEKKEQCYVIPILLSIPATSYDKAVEEAQKLATRLHHIPGVNVEVETSFEHDNEGQRVLYLHPEEPEE